jgi:hypothetical protein
MRSAARHRVAAIELFQYPPAQDISSVLLHSHMSASDQPAPFVRKIASQEGLSPAAAPHPASAPSHVTNEIIPAYKPHTGERSQCVHPALRDSALVTQTFPLQVSARRDPGCQRRPRVHVPPHPRSQARLPSLSSAFSHPQSQRRWLEHSADLSGWSDG